MPTPSLLTNLLTVDEAAAALHLSPRTIRKWVGQRRIAYVKLGRAVRFEASAIASLIKRHQVFPRRSQARV